jgi:hypothetical protein
MNLGASLFERNLVHRQLHDVDTASVLRQEILDSHGIGNAACIKPLTLVRNDQRDPFADLAAAADVN